MNELKAESITGNVWQNAIGSFGKSGLQSLGRDVGISNKDTGVWTAVKWRYSAYQSYMASHGADSRMLFRTPPKPINTNRAILDVLLRNTTRFHTSFLCLGPHNPICGCVLHPSFQYEL